MTTSASDSSRGDVRNVMIGLFGVAAVAWIYLFTGTAMQMPMSDGGSMPMQPEWTLAYAATALTMWAIMMVAMMLPVGAPAVIRAVRRANSAQQERGLGAWPYPWRFLSNLRLGPDASPRHRRVDEPALHGRRNAPGADRTNFSKRRSGCTSHWCRPNRPGRLRVGYRCALNCAGRASRR